MVGLLSLVLLIMGIVVSAVAGERCGCARDAQTMRGVGR
jgi:hypothetical protein